MQRNDEGNKEKARSTGMGRFRLKKEVALGHLLRRSHRPPPLERLKSSVATPSIQRYDDLKAKVEKVLIAKR